MWRASRQGFERLTGIALDAEPPDSGAAAPPSVPLDLGPIDLRPRGGVLAVLRRLEEADIETGMVVIRSGPTGLDLPGRSSLSAIAIHEGPLDSREA